jgi:hypothetical protein
MPISQQNQSGGRGVTLIDFFSLVVGVAGCSGAVLTGKNSGSQVMGWIIGLAVGLGCSSVVWKFGGRAIYRLKLHEAKPSPFRLILSWIFLFAVVAWGVASAFFGSWLTKLVVHFLAAGAGHTG